MTEGADVSFLIRFTAERGGPELRVRGKVLRAEMRTLGVCDMAVEFTRPLAEDVW